MLGRFTQAQNLRMFANWATIFENMWIFFFFLCNFCSLFKVFIPVWNIKILFRFAVKVVNCEIGLIGNCSALNSSDTWFHCGMCFTSGFDSPKREVHLNNVSQAWKCIHSVMISLSYSFLDIQLWRAKLSMPWWRIAGMEVSIQLHALREITGSHWIRRAVKKFPEMWYNTVMVGHMTTLT